MNKDESMIGMSTGLKITVASFLTIGSIFTGANGLAIFSLFAAVAAAIVGCIAVAEASKETQLAGSVTGNVACVLSALGTLFVLTAPGTVTFSVTATVAVIPVIFWIALTAVYRRQYRV